MGAACSHACLECPSFRDVWADCPDAQLRRRRAVARLRARQYDPQQPVFARGHMCYDRLMCRCAYVRCLVSLGAQQRLHARVGHCRALLFGMLYRRVLLARCLASPGALRRLQVQVGHCRVLLFGMLYRRALLARCLASPGARWHYRAKSACCRAHHALMPHCHALSVRRTARRDDLWLHLGYARLARQFGVHGGLCIHLRSAFTPSAQC